MCPELASWFAELPDARRQELCKYTGAHLWFHILVMFLTRAGSCHAFDQVRNSGSTPANLGRLCGQGPEDARFDGQPTVTCSDNAARHAARTDPARVAEVSLRLMRWLISRRIFDRCRLFDSWYVVLVDGSVQEKCRKGFEHDGKTLGHDGARYRYVVQLGLLGPEGIFLPFLHEAVDMHDPIADKEDCELEAFKRLIPRLKQAFPRLPLCIVADALYATEGIAASCAAQGWRYVLSLKEGRQPTLWNELLELLPLHLGNKLRLHDGPHLLDPISDLRWVEDVLLGKTHTTHVILQGEITTEAATLYAWVTNFGHLTANRVLAIANAAGRQRHCIEDHFNTQKNHGIGLEHVFRANSNASKNYYTIMQVAQIMWELFYSGCLRRLYEWARWTSQQGLARALGEGLRTTLLSADIPPLGQLRFVT